MDENIQSKSSVNRVKKIKVTNLTAKLEILDKFSNGMKVIEIIYMPIDWCYLYFPKYIYT